MGPAHPLWFSLSALLAMTVGFGWFHNRCTRPGPEADEVMHDLSLPIYVNGKHWGGFRIGYKS